MTENSMISKRGLIRAKHAQNERDQEVRDEYVNTMDFDLSLTLAPGEIRRLLDTSNLTNAAIENSRYLTSSLQELDRSRIIQDDIHMRDKADILFPQFLEVLQSRTNDSEVFDTIQDLIQTCSGILEEVTKTVRNDKILSRQHAWLEHERNTWRLLYCLYKDRIVVQKDVDCDVPPLGGSEKDVITQLYSTNFNLREYQLIVDWLENCALEQNRIQIGHYTDRTVAWENTLLQLKNPEGVAFGGGRDIVQSLDPDAAVRERRPLHALDIEDQTRLSKHIFLEIRQGRIEDAKALCEYCGQSWRAAILEGWRLHEDPNYDVGNVTSKSPIEGNPRRDIWKKFAWMMADSKKFDEYTRAISGVFCGHLESLLGLLNDSWEDLLWAYLKVQIDIRVESEIRTCCMKNYLAMPEQYWNGKMSLEQIFDELSAHKNSMVRNTANNPINIIQKYLILDDVPEMMRNINSWIDGQRLTPHMLRFLTHIVLFMRQIGKEYQEDISDKIIKAYVESLIDIGDVQLIAFYTAALAGDLQIILYSQYLQTVKETAVRSAALEEGLAAGLDIDTITCYTVETIRNKLPDTNKENELQMNISNFDEEKISALEWLTFYPQQKGELLWQTNAMIRSFMAESKIECVRKAFNMVPTNSIAQIISIFGSKDNLPCKEECSIKEYLCHQTYLAAIDGFNDWTHLYHNRPKEPELAKSSSNFTERIASEHKQQAYKAELDRWKMSLSEQSKITRDLLFNVLLFPDKGWLIDPDTAKDAPEFEDVLWKNRQIQLENLRKLCIPEIILLLNNVMNSSGDYKGCIQLADEIASEERQLYNVYPKHKLAEILSKIAESSLSLMNEKYDAWGYTATV